MSGALRIGVRFEPHWPPEELPAYARTLERLGYDELWFSEDCFWSGGPTMAASALAHTERLRVGIGLLPVVTRNVATMAMELATLERLAPGRLTVGVGTGIPEWMRQIGARIPRRLDDLEETAALLRRLLQGAAVTYEGRRTLYDVRLGHPPQAVPPLLFGTTGPKGLAAAARTADGIVLPEVSSPAAVRWARASAGEPNHTVVFAYLSLADTTFEGVGAARSELARWAHDGVFTHLTERAGIGADGRGELDDVTVQAMAVAGDAGDCRAALERWQEAGATALVLVGGDAPEHGRIERFAKDVLRRR
jgi:5,10-methylenetetrahydromethanopterin reductase